jgi:hypothetical protein
MAEVTPDAAMRRILLALHGGEDAAALEAATALAEGLRARLEGLFVEDADLLRLAALPFATEIALFSAVARPLELAQLERQLRAEAAAARRLLETGATRRSLEYSFTVVRGRLASVVLATPSEADVFIFGRAPSRHGEAHALLRGPVLAVFDSSERAPRVLEVATALASRGSESVLVYVAAESEEDGTALETELKRDLAALHASAETLAPAPFDVDTLARTVKARGVSLLVLRQGRKLQDPQRLHELLEAMPCPVILVR